MSSAEAGSARATLNRRSLVRGLALLLAATPALSACGNSGFHPLYGTTASGAGMQERLAQVEVAPIPGRVGLRIRNEVRFQANGPGEALPPTHRLEVTLAESMTSTLVRTDGAAMGLIYAVNANFKLVEIKTKKVVLTGTSHARASFERFSAVYSNVRARDDAENRAAKTIADDLTTRVAAYLSGAA
jgi:LPS-assembly lipoprotein